MDHPMVSKITSVQLSSAWVVIWPTLTFFPHPGLGTKPGLQRCGWNPRRTGRGRGGECLGSIPGWRRGGRVAAGQRRRDRAMATRLSRLASTPSGSHLLAVNRVLHRFLRVFLQFLICILCTPMPPWTLLPLPFYQCFLVRWILWLVEAVVGAVALTMSYTCLFMLAIFIGLKCGEERRGGEEWSCSCSGAA